MRISAHFQLDNRESYRMARELIRINHTTLEAPISMVTLFLQLVTISNDIELRNVDTRI